MHELSLTQTLMENVLDHAEGKDVQTIHLKIGLLSCVDGRAIQTCFDAVKPRLTQLHQAALEVETCRPKATCRDCTRQFLLNLIGEPCQCGSLNYALEGGEELTISSISFYSVSV